VSKTTAARVDEIKAKVLECIAAQVEIALAAARAPRLLNEEDRADMTMVEQAIAADALKPPAEAPMYLHGAMRVLASASKATLSPDENQGKSPVFQVVGTLNVNAWQQTYEQLREQEKLKENAIMLEAVAAEKADPG